MVSSYHRYGMTHETFTLQVYMTSIRLRISLFQVYLLLCSLLRGFSAFHTEGQVQFGLFALAMTPCHAGFKRLRIEVSPTKDALGELILVVGSFPVMVYMYLLESIGRWMTRTLKQFPTTVLRRLSSNGNHTTSG